jgi:hypothetical protein
VGKVWKAHNTSYFRRLWPTISLGRKWIEGPGRFNFDANLIKRVKIAETEKFEFRVDAVSVLNHRQGSLMAASLCLRVFEVRPSHLANGFGRN